MQRLIRPLDFVRLAGRVHGPSLFFLGAALLLLAAALLRGEIYRWGAIAALAAGVAAAGPRRIPVNLIGVAVALFGGWLLVNAAFVTPYYSAESLYRPVLLLLGFLAASSLDRQGLVVLFRAGAGLLAVLVLLGLAQFFLGFWHLAQNAQRAAAVFVTPNTFAAAINLALLPVLALAVLRRGGGGAVFLSLWMFAGLLATESRGGYLGFAAGFAYIVLGAALTRRRQAFPMVVKAFGGLLAAAAVFALALFAVRHSGRLDGFGETLLSRGFNYRLELAEVALHHVLDHPLSGFGANMFRSIYEMERPAGIAYSTIYQYAHNDYLQIWLEFGVIGAGLLIAVAALALRTGVSRDVPPEESAARLACGAALASVLAHAAVDFPLYVPFLLMGTGAYLGAMAVYRGDDERLLRGLAPALARIAPIRSPLLAALLLLLVAWMSAPMVAEMAAQRSLVALFAGNLEGGLRWQTVARALEPRNPVHYWAEGVMWREQASATGSKALARKADEMFAAGMRANPYEIVNHLERARLRRNQAALFDGPVPTEEVLAWTAEAVRLRPDSLPANIEHARALAQAGRAGDARRLAAKMLDRYPESAIVLRLASDLGL